MLAEVGGTSRAVQIGRSLEQLDALFAGDRPAAVVVQGDTNATLAGALAANARAIPLVHVEAGLRSHDPAMPEEHNRVLVDAVSDVLCAATPENRANLLAEGVGADRISVTGNTVVEAVRAHLPDDGRRSALLARHGLVPDRYVLATVHRPENTDGPATLRTVLTELADLATDEVPVLLPSTRAPAPASRRSGWAGCWPESGSWSRSATGTSWPWPATPRCWSPTRAASRRSARCWAAR